MTAQQTWGPVSGRWTLSREEGAFWLTISRDAVLFEREGLDLLEVRRLWFRHALLVRTHGETKKLHGLKGPAARTLSLALETWRARERLGTDLAAVVTWSEAVRDVVDAGVLNVKWVTEEQILDLEATRPAVDTAHWFVGDSGAAVEMTLNDAERAAIAVHAADVRGDVHAVNEETLATELELQKTFFDTVETSPLTDEQARAVVCFDNRVQVVAAAGSGKTSVMVARAAYALLRGFVAPERILLLAFNRAAADELQVRVTMRLEALGLPIKGIRATTFHAFGLSVIGRANGKKPRLASWLDGGQDIAMVCRLVDELSDASMDFRLRWDFFRLLYARASSDEVNGGEPDGWDKQRRCTGFKTANGEVVRSEGERVIADWLFHCGVDYEYERAYHHDVADTAHSQYRPDFYYPSIDVWHEHWALGPDGMPPDDFPGYAESMDWKKRTHEAYGTTLVETTWSQVFDQGGLSELSDTLTELGLPLDWNPDRARPDSPALKHEDLARLVRTFMTHVKSNGLTREDLQERMTAGRPGFRTVRTRMFVGLFWEIHDAWQSRLRKQNSLDFEDMLVLACEALESGRASAEHDLVLVDELQDASQARARLVAALVADRDKFLLAVGDDWQSINRFAGADLSVMTRFQDWFGAGHTLRLQTTFRCPQSICDVAGAFVSKNSRQLHKEVRSAQGSGGAPIVLLRVKGPEQLPAAITEYLSHLAAGVLSGDVPRGKNGPVTVNVLGRYNFDRQVMPRWQSDDVEATFRTVHGSKGLEADYVIVPNLTNGVFGFPSGIADDPILDLAMADPDPYPHAEERRLLYVALTRARRAVVLMTQNGRESPFALELMKAKHVVVRGDADEPLPEICSKCHEGTMVRRTGPYGEFLSCNRFPRCRNTGKLVSEVAL